MSQEEFLAYKIPILMKEGYSRSQAIAVSYSLYRRGEGKAHAQYGGVPIDESLQGNPMLGYYTKPGNQNMPAPTYYDQNKTYFEANQPTSPQYDASVYTPGMPVGATPKTLQENNTQEINRVNIDNPFVGVSLENALNYAGRGFGENDPWKAGVGTSLSLLKGSRNFLSGYGAGKTSKDTYNDYIQKLYKDNTPNEAMQGGGIKNSEILAMNALTDNPNGNTNTEGGEYVKRTNGMVQPIVGEPHIKNNKKADGVDVHLNDGDKVLSDYLKLQPTDIKELKERYNISLKKGDTPAKVLEKIEAKIGLKKETEKLADSAEKLEKALKIKDKASKELSIETLQTVIATQNEKINALKEVSAVAFDDLFDMQEKQPKQGDGTQIYDKNGKEVTEENKPTAQQGGIFELADKYGISKERAQELVSAQQGMVQGQQEENQEGQASNPQEEQGEISQEQIMQAVMQMLQQGAKPEEIVQNLVQNGVPQEVAVQAVQTMMQQSQGEEQVEGQASNPQEEGMETAQQGGKVYAQQSLPDGYTFSTRYTPKVEGYTAEGIGIIPQDSLSGVETTQNYTGEGYGKQMADVNSFVDKHKWYFDTEEKKNKFKEAVKKKGQQQEVLDFQNAYNQELRKRAQNVGLPKEEENRIINEVGFSGRGVQGYDGLFGAFTSTRPLIDFKKADGTVKVEVKPVGEDTTKTQELDVVNKTNNIMPLLPTDLRLPPSGVAPLLKSEVNLGRIEPIKMTTEPMLAEQTRQQYTAQDQLSATGLPPQIQQAIQAQNLASGQIASNDAISKVEGFNRGQQYNSDVFNIGQRAKENITNEQFSQDYQAKMLGSIDNTQRDWRNYLIEGNLQNRANWRDVENMNLLNATSENFQYIPSQGVQFLNTEPGKLGSKPKYTAEDLAKMTPEQYWEIVRNETALSRKKAYESQK